MNMPSPITFPQWPTRPVYKPTKEDLDETELVYALRDIEVGLEVLKRRLLEVKDVNTATN